MPPLLTDADRTSTFGLEPLPWRHHVLPNWSVPTLRLALLASTDRNHLGMWTARLRNQLLIQPKVSGGVTLEFGVLQTI